MKNEETNKVEKKKKAKSLRSFYFPSLNNGNGGNILAKSQEAATELAEKKLKS